MNGPAVMILPIKNHHGRAHPPHSHRCRRAQPVVLAAPRNPAGVRPPPAKAADAVVQWHLNTSTPLLRGFTELAFARSGIQVAMNINRSIVCGLFVLCANAALAAPPPPGSEDAVIMKGYEDWVYSQLTPDGRRCCDISDGRPVPTRIRHGHWEAFVTKAKWPDLQGNEGWRQIPDDLVVHEANPVGWPIIWIYEGEIRCFRTPTMS